jgi:adenylate cyclase
MARGPNVIVRGWRNVREAGAQRLAVTALLLIAALLFARFSWGLPITGDAERGLFDVRSVVAAPKIENQDQRILLVVYDDKTLIDARKRSPLDRGLLARALKNIDGMGAKAIGLDMLFDQPQDEDPELIATLRGMKTPVSVGYVDMATNASDIIFAQQQYLKEFLGQLKGSKAHPASVRLDNAWSVTRNWPSLVRGEPPVLGRSMMIDAGARAATMPGYEGAVRYRLTALKDVPEFTELRIDLFADTAIAPALADKVRGKYVLIGGDIVDTDRVATSFTSITGEQVPGLAVHAEMIAQMLDGARLPHPLPATLWLLAVLVVGSAVLTGLLEIRNWRIYPLVGVQFAVLLGLPFLLHLRGIDTYGLPAAGWLIAWVLAFAAITSAARASTAVQRRFAQNALGKYLPREMAQEIIEHPELLALHGEKKAIFVLFSDLEGFTKMSHAIEPEQVARLLNRYLEMLSQVVLDHGGVIDKFVGDAVVAFWGAPIARPDDGNRAAKAGYALWQAGEEFRRTAGPDVPPIGKTRVGLHYGDAVVGNFGGESRIQYTALGDSMNTAARLESANKALDSGVMASREFMERSLINWWRPMGRVILRGRAKPVEIFEPAPDFPEEDRKVLVQAMILADGDRPAAIALVEEIVARHPDDRALKNLLYRLNNMGERNAYDLG